MLNFKEISKDLNIMVSIVYRIFKVKNKESRESDATADSILKHPLAEVHSDECFKLTPL